MNAGGLNKKKKGPRDVFFEDSDEEIIQDFNLTDDDITLIDNYYIQFVNKTLLDTPLVEIGD